ncbi:MAG: cyclic nucleotide-binding domain-containing protein [Actinomycetota bacterium]|nr:cyclic nucleotide-binding domain-containing protein [Actinomycetota bacterium]
MVDRKLIAAVELFSVLGPADIDQLWAAGDDRMIAAGEELFAYGSDAEELYIISSGRFAISAPAPGSGPGGEEAVLAEVGRGEVLGEMPLFDGLGRSAGATALEDSEVIALPFNRVKRLFLAHPDALWEVLALVVRRMRALDEATAERLLAPTKAD